MSSAQTTHSTECWKWHLECAGREVERLRGELAREHKQSELAWSKADEWGAEALEAHLKNARLGAVISRLRRRAERERTRYLPAGDILDLLAQMEVDDV